MDLIIPSSSGSTASVDFKESYIQACKELLHKLYFMLHTDTCPGYDDLSPQQQTEINDLWLQVMKSTNDELFSFSPSHILYSMPDYEQLESIYLKACKILEVDPGDYTLGNRLEFMIRKGSSIASIMDFLRAETEKLSLHLAHLELVQNEYTHEDQSQIYRNALTDIEAHSASLEDEISELEQQISNLKKRISSKSRKVIEQ